MAQPARSDRSQAQRHGSISGPQPVRGMLVDLVTWMRERLMHMPASTEPFAEIIAKIASMEHMKPGWNGHRAMVPPKEARQAAIEFLRSIPRHFPSGIQVPTITAPTSDGGVVLEWRLADAPRALEFVFLPDRVYEWALREKEHTIQYSDDATPGDLFDVMKQHVVGRAIVHLQ